VSQCCLIILTLFLHFCHTVATLLFVTFFFHNFRTILTLFSHYFCDLECLELDVIFQEAGIGDTIVRLFYTACTLLSHSCYIVVTLFTQYLALLLYYLCDLECPEFDVIFQEAKIGQSIFRNTQVTSRSLQGQFCQGDVTVLLRCYNSVLTVLLQRCHSIVTVSLQCCYSSVTV
jgi:hypothetical protein